MVATYMPCVTVAIGQQLACFNVRRKPADADPGPPPVWPNSSIAPLRNRSLKAPKSPNLRNWLSQKPNSWSKPPRSWVWTLHGAHLLLQTRTRVLNQDLDDLFRRWYPKFRSQPQTQESERKAA